MAGSTDKSVDGFEAFYVASAMSAARLGHLLTGSASAGHDLAQDAMSAVRARWDELDDPAAFLRAAVVNRSKNVHRRRARERAFLRRRLPEAVTSNPDFDEAWLAIRRLPPRPRAVVVLRFYEDLTITQIADLLDIPEGTVKSTLHRTLRQLKEMLS